MDGSDLRSMLGNYTSSRGDQSKKAWSLRSCEGDGREQPNAPQSIKICDQDSMLQSEEHHMVEHNPFYPYKKLGQLNPSDALECGSTTGPLEESDPLRKWKEMKKNGFLSSSHGGIPLPEQRDRRSRKRKPDEIKTKAEAPKREQVSRFAKLAAPSGLLSRLDPGIIKRVRNSKQVHSIIEAMALSEKQDGQLQVGKDQNCVEISESEIDENRFHCGTSTSSQLTSEYDDDTLALNLSSDNGNSASGDDFSANQENINSLSFKAATVASQWLELLQLDIKGRLAALQRSKKRVRSVIQTELPYLSSRELSSNMKNDSVAGCSISSASDTHMARWRSLFGQMDIALYDEAKHLERSLRQVQDMQLHCEKGLKFVGVNCSSQLGSSEGSRGSRKREEMECEVMAAAASIYSTCNLIMTKENVPCF